MTIPIQPDYFRSLDSQNTDQTTDQTNQVANYGRNKVTEKEKQLLDLFDVNPQITQVEVARILGWKPALVKYYVEALKKKGFLERVGTSHNGHWKVIR